MVVLPAALSCHQHAQQTAAAAEVGKLTGFLLLLLQGLTASPAPHHQHQHHETAAAAEAGLPAGLLLQLLETVQQVQMLRHHTVLAPAAFQTAEAGLKLLLLPEQLQPLLQPPHQLGCQLDLAHLLLLLQSLPGIGPGGGYCCLGQLLLPLTVPAAA
jgi:hypothetical protein